MAWSSRPATSSPRTAFGPQAVASRPTVAATDKTKERRSQVISQNLSMRADGRDGAGAGTLPLLVRRWIPKEYVIPAVEGARAAPRAHPARATAHSGNPAQFAAAAPPA